MDIANCTLTALLFGNRVQTTGDSNDEHSRFAIEKSRDPISKFSVGIFVKTYSNYLI